MTGKGDNPRPLSVTREAYRENWERVFKTVPANAASDPMHDVWIEALRDRARAKLRMIGKKPNRKRKATK